MSILRGMLMSLQSSMCEDMDVNIFEMFLNVSTKFGQ